MGHNESAAKEKAEKIRSWQKTGLIGGRGQLIPQVPQEERQNKNCAFHHVVERNGMGVCRHCGRVLYTLTFERQLDYAKNRDGQSIRHAEPVRDKLRRVRTIIMPHRKGEKGQHLTPEKERYWVHMNKRHKQFGSMAKRNLVGAEQGLRGIMIRLGFTDPCDFAWQICEWVAENKISQGRTLEATIAAAVYVAAVEQGFPVTYARIMACSDVPEEKQLRRVIALYLGKKPAKWSDFPLQLDRKKFFDPNRYIRDVCNELGLDYPVAIQVEECVRLLTRRHRSHHRPENKVASAVKAVCGDAVRWDVLEQVTGVKVASLVAYWREVVPILKDLGYLPVGDEADTGTRSTSDTGE